MQLAMKDEMREGDTGQQSSSGILCRLQKTWKTSRPEPYVSFVFSVHEAQMTSKICSNWPSEIELECSPTDSVGCEFALWKVCKGDHSHRQSLVQQCGQRHEGFGVRLGL